MSPRLTFFVELESEALDELFRAREVLSFLVGRGCGVSMGLLDRSERRAVIVRELEGRGVPVTAWLLLPVEAGYWLTADNAEQARATWRETAEWAEREGLRFARVGLDVEFPRARRRDPGDGARRRGVPLSVSAGRAARGVDAAAALARARRRARRP
jgi:hypothetical protein